MLIPEYTHSISVAEFEAFVMLPANEAHLFELIDGEIVEKVPSNAYVSEIAQLIGFFIRLFLRENHLSGHVTEGQGGYVVATGRYAPDVAYISKIRQPDLAKEGYNPNPPELAVEVEFPTSAQSERRLRKKVLNYMTVGTLLWVVYPETKEVEVYTPGQPVRTLTINDILDGGEVLPGFTLAIKEIFPETISE